MNRVTPVTPQKNDTLTVSGTVTNRGRSTVTDARIVLYSGQRLNTRSAIEQASSRTGFRPGQDGKQVTGRNTSLDVDDLSAGQTRSFTLTVPVKRLELDADGVYQLGVALNGQNQAEAYPHVLGIERTFLPWQTAEAKTRTQLTFVWPLISSAHMTARTESNRQQTPVFRDDGLAADISPGGRLHQMVNLGRDLPVSWVVDPDLLATVDAMTKPYKVETPDGVVAGQSQQAARAWLNDLQRATEGREVVALPFGDPDLASLAHRGRTVSGALNHLRPATEAAVKTVETILHTTPNTSFAWPVEGALDPSVVSVATSAGARKILTRSDSVRETGGLPYTPTAARPIGGGVTAVSADARLSKLFRGDLTRADASTQAVQRFLAQTLSITEQKPNARRSIVVAPQRMPSVSEARTMARAVRALADNGRWAEFAELGEAAKAKPDPKAQQQVPSADSYPANLRKQELETDAFEEIQRTRSTLDDFTVILSQDDRVITPFGGALRRELSTSWRGRPAEAAAYRESVQAHLTELTRQVRLVQKSRMTLSGRSATIPVTVQNNLIQPVDGLELRLTSGRRLGLEVKEEVKPVVVEGGHSQSIKFDTTAKANGRYSMEAQLFTKDNKPYGPPMSFQVDVTEITSTVLLVIAGGMLLVVLAGVRMYTQRKRRGPQPDPDAPLEPSAAAEESSQEEEPSRAQAASTGRTASTGQAASTGTARPEDDSGDSSDTSGPGNTDTPGTGEKVDR
ncbi:hypothetical protein H3146_24195 [Streptomyces sp. OF3]|uniref:Uncharacterized protein n=1 Tax=Streptomyces alkaliterrae TaxID=2213162 RepID=A0A7W3WQ60_9ACTN|nr:hypothetical protein [Streptomyces alkaliterrae]